jgi:hypothetical protein
MKRNSVVALMMAGSGLWFLGTTAAGKQPWPAFAVVAGVGFLVGAFLVATSDKGKGR